MPLLFADVLQDVCARRKTGTLFAVVDQRMDHMVRVYFEGGEILHLVCGPLKGQECLAHFDQYNFGLAVFLAGMKPPRVLENDLPRTENIIATVKQTGKTIRRIAFAERGKIVSDA